MLIRKLFAGVGVVTGIYTAAALQSSPEQTDANVCKLLRRFYSGVPDQCVSSSLDNWGTLFAAAFVLLCIFLLLYDLRERVPVYRVCGAAIKRTILRTKYAGNMIEPWHVIIIGLVIAAGGVGWQLYIGSPTTEIGELRKKLRTAEMSANAAQTQLNSRAAADALLALAKTKLPETDADRALRGMAALHMSEKEFTKKTVRELRALYEGRTALQADAFMADEKGKLIEVEGIVVMIHAGMAFLNVGQDIHNGMNDSVECRFGVAWNAKLATYREKEHMRLRGAIGPSQNGAQIYLQDCEIIG